MSFDHAWLLWLLPLAALPLLAQPGGALDNAWPALMQRDRASEALGWALRVFGVLALAALVVGLAGPYWPEYQIERVGKGAEIVLVLDRSRSMDQGFAGARRAGAAVKGTGPEAIDYYFSQTPGTAARVQGQGGAAAAGRIRRQAARRPFRHDRLQHPADPDAGVHAEERSDPGRHRGRQHRTRPVRNQHRPGAAVGAVVLRGSALHRLAHRHAGVRRRRPARQRRQRAHRPAGAQASRRDLLALPALGQQSGVDAADRRGAGERRYRARVRAAPLLRFDRHLRTTPTKRAMPHRCKRPSKRSTASRTCPSPISTRCRGATCRHGASAPRSPACWCCWRPT